MEFKKLIGAAALMGAMSFGATSASAQQAYYTALTNVYGTATACYVCHDSSGKSGFTTFGNAFAAIATHKTNPAGAFTQLDATYGAQLTAGSLPQSSAPASTGGSSGGGCVTSSITTPLTMALAMLTLGFFVRRKKD